MTFLAYRRIKIMVIGSQITKNNMRFSIPWVHTIPAASEAIMVEKGLVVEHMVPIAEPKKTEAKATIASYFAAIKTGINIGKMAGFFSKPKGCSTKGN